MAKIAHPSLAHIAENHPIEACKERTFNRDLILSSCLKICEKLHKNGFDAWLVGGCIRDLLLGHTPKDFDITTVATPQQIKGIFKRGCRIIGKRFQIVHIYWGDRTNEPIEVSTLRAMAFSQMNENKRVINHQGRIERDNIFGQSLKEDAYRRDFTVNAIYYHPVSDQCVDHIIKHFTQLMKDYVLIYAEKMKTRQSRPDNQFFISSLYTAGVFFEQKEN